MPVSCAEARYAVWRKTHGNDEQADVAAPKPGPHNLRLLITRRVRMPGFIVIDYLDRAGEAIDALTGCVLVAGCWVAR